MRHLSSSEAVRVIQRVAFAGSLATFAIACWRLLGARPDIVHAVATEPMKLRNVLLVCGLAAVASALWPAAGWLARRYVAWRTGSN